MKRKINIQVFTAICVMLLFFLYPLELRASEPSMTVYGIYLGQAKGDAGDATLIESNGQYLLMDLGEASTYEKVRDFLKERGVTRLSLYYSHFHGDHTGGFGKNQGYERLLQDFTVDKVYLPSRTFSPKKDYSSYYQKIEKLYKKYYPNASITNSLQELKVGSVFTFGDVSVNIIGPVGLENSTISDYKDYGTVERQGLAYVNNYSLVARVVCGSTVFLTAGDIEEAEEKELVKKYGNTGLLKADIYKMSHHGYARSSSETIMPYIQPTYSFATNSGKAAGYSMSGGVKFRQVSGSLYRCCQWGFCYLIGNEKKSVAFQVKGGKVNIFRTSNMTAPLEGLVKVVGGDGVNQKYDYYLLGGDGKPKTGIQKVKGKTYYFGTGGCREYGMFSYNGTYLPWRSFLVNGKWEYRYFVQKTHEMKTGWLESEGLLYFLNPKTGYRATGITRIDKKTYCFTEDGTVMRSQWVKRNGRRYYLDADGVAYTGWQKVGKKNYHFDKNGMRSLGLTKIDNHFFYFNKKGFIEKNKSILVDGYMLSFDENGVLQNVPNVGNVTLLRVNEGKGNLTIRWRNVRRADGYNIYIAEKAKGKYKLVQTVENGRKDIGIIPGLKKGKRYYVKVKAYIQLGECKIYSRSYSNMKKAIVQ